MYLSASHSRPPLRPFRAYARSGYLGAAGSIMGAVFVWFNLVEGPRKAVTKRVPLAHLSPRSLAYFYPLVACVALEFVSQMALVSIETLVPPLLRLWRGWSCDALGELHALCGMPSARPVARELVRACASMCEHVSVSVWCWRGCACCECVHADA